MRIADLEDGDQIVTKDFLQRELRAQLSELKAEINSKFAELKADLYPKFAELKTDIKQVHADLMQVQVNFQGKMYGMVLGSVRIGGRCLRSDYCEPLLALRSMIDKVISYVDDNGELAQIMESDLQRLDELYEPDEFDQLIERVTRENPEKMARLTKQIQAHLSFSRLQSQ